MYSTAHVAKVPQRFSINCAVAWQDKGFFESSLYTAADWRQGAVSRVLRIQKMSMVTTGANREKYAGYTW